MPYWIASRTRGASKAVSWRSLKGVAAGYLRLFCDIYVRRKERGGAFSETSQTAKRRQEWRQACLGAEACKELQDRRDTVSAGN
jgi:hypothetical protein